MIFDYKKCLEKNSENYTVIDDIWGKIPRGYAKIAAEIRQKRYASALRHACGHHLHDLVKALVNASSQLGFDINQASQQGETALDLWVQSPNSRSPESQETENFLRENGAKRICQQSLLIAVNEYTLCSYSDHYKFVGTTAITSGIALSVYHPESKKLFFTHISELSSDMTEKETVLKQQIAEVLSPGAQVCLVGGWRHLKFSQSLYKSLKDLFSHVDAEIHVDTEGCFAQEHQSLVIDLKNGNTYRNIIPLEAFAGGYQSILNSWLRDDQDSLTFVENTRLNKRARCS